MKQELLVYDGFQRCPYLPGQVARMPLYRQLRVLDPDAADQRFANAERRVGRALYRTSCPTCKACEGIRVPVAEFTPTKSQRRTAARWDKVDWRVDIGAPHVTAETLDLFNRHKRSRGLADEDDLPMTASSYQAWLVDTCVETVEMRYFIGDSLVGVGIVDLGRTAVSSVYFFFDTSPEVSRLSPGVFSVLQEIELCRRTGREHLYLGLYVRDCDQLNYKAGYQPSERLIDGDWRRIGENK